MPTREQLQRYIAAGKCPCCGKVKDREGYQCKKCLKASNERSQRNKRRRIEEGRCRDCSRPLPDDGINNTVTCPACTMRPRFDKLFK